MSLQPASWLQRGFFAISECTQWVTAIYQWCSRHILIQSSTVDIPIKSGRLTGHSSESLQGSTRRLVELDENGEHLFSVRPFHPQRTGGCLSFLTESQVR